VIVSWVLRTVSMAPKVRGHLMATALAVVALGASMQAAWSSSCKPHRIRAPFFVKTMGPCAFDPATLRFAGEPAEQARCLMRGMDHSRNLGPPMERLPSALADRVGTEAGLPSRETLSAYFSSHDLEWDFAAYLWTPLARANGNDPNAPMAGYFVIHDTSGPNYGRRAFPEDIDVRTKLNKLSNFVCTDGWGKAHVVINRFGEMLLTHELSIPWRETKFEQAANFAGAMRGLFVHVELIQPRRGRGNAQSPNPSFTAAQYDRLALLYVDASVRAGRWLIPAYHAALDGEIFNGHDDPLNFDAESFADSLQRLLDKLSAGGETAAAAPSADRRVPWGEVDATQVAHVAVTTPPNPPAPEASAAATPDVERPAADAQTAKTEAKVDTEKEAKSDGKTVDGAEACRTRFAHGRRRRVCETDVAETGERGTHAHPVHSRGRAGHAWHHAGYLRARHERGRARPGRA